MKRILLILIAAVTVSSCAPLPESVTSYSIQTAYSVPDNYLASGSEDSVIIDGLLDLFDDKTLAGLVQQSMAGNFDIQRLEHQIAEAGFLANSIDSDRWPKVDGNLSASSSRDDDGTTDSSYSPTLDVRWELDIWGKIGNRQNAQKATENALRERHHAIRDSIGAQVMQSWFDVVTLEKLLAVELQRLAVLERSAENSRRLYRAGLNNLDDLAAIERDMRLAEVNIAVAKGDKKSAARVLNILLGKYPADILARTADLPRLQVSPRPGSPNDLLAHRPDLREYWQEVIAADESVKVFYKEQFPTLNITGSFGTQNDDFSSILSGATIWSLAGNFTAPIFNYGQLENNLNAAQSKAEQAWINYLQVVLNAFHEVEQALDSEKLLASQEKQQSAALNKAKSTSTIFEKRYQQGLVSILELLDAQNATFDIKSQLLNIRNERLNNRVKLALALGKGV